MVYLKWLALAPVMLIVTALTYPLALILPFFASDQEGPIDNDTGWGVGPRLPKWLSIFQHPDNNLYGDKGWREEHAQWRFKFPKPVANYLSMVGWLWRNPGYGVGLVKFDSATPITATFTGNQAVNDSPGVEGTCHIYAGGLWQLVWVKRITETHCIYVNLGWNIKGLINDPRAKYVATYALSPRISKFKV